MVATVKIDTKEIERAFRNLSDQARRQIPFATALALTRTAQALKKDLGDEIGQAFDRPTPYIQRGTFIVPAKKNSLQAEVGIIDRPKGANNASPALYVREQFGGGARGQKPFERALQGMGALPAGWRAMPGEDLSLDRFGNPNRKDLAEVFGALRTRMSVNKGRGRRAVREGYFVVMPGSDPRTRHLRPGIWRRRMAYGTGAMNSRPPIAVFVFVRPASYRQRINLPKLASITVKREFSAQFRAALSRALETAR